MLLNISDWDDLVDVQCLSAERTDWGGPDTGDDAGPAEEVTTLRHTHHATPAQLLQTQGTPVTTTHTSHTALHIVVNTG